jgi:hypothetical protein
MGALDRKYRRGAAEIDLQWSPVKMVGLPGTSKCKAPARADRPRRVVGCGPPNRPIETFDVVGWLGANRVTVEPGKPKFHVPTGLISSPSKPPSGRADDDREQAREWLSCRAPAVEGQRGKRHTYRTITTVMFGWELSESDTLSLVLEWNATCKPPWQGRELAATVRDAAREGSRYGSGFMRRGRRPRKEREPRRCSLSPVTFDDGPGDDAAMG